MRSNPEAKLAEFAIEPSAAERAAFAEEAVRFEEVCDGLARFEREAGSGQSFGRLWLRAAGRRALWPPSPARPCPEQAETRVGAALERAGAIQAECHAFVELWPDRALAQARLLGPGDAGRSLAGVPFAYKDAFASAGRLPTLGAGRDIRWPGPPSRLLARLAGQGAVAIGATGLDPFCYTATGLNAIDGRVLHPLDAGLAVGGSSSGSAVGVAAGAVPFALGTDTGGSVRIPAALCGVFGLKPSHGLLSDPGMAPLSPSQDTPGVLAVSAAMLRDVMAALLSPGPGRSAQGRAARAEDGPVRIGLAPEFNEGADPAVASALHALAARCTKLGMNVRDVPMPPLDTLNAVASHITAFEAFAEHGPALARHPGRYPDPCRRRLLAASLVGREEYERALRLRGVLLQQVLDTAFQAVDFILCPTVRLFAPRVDDLPEDDIDRAGRLGLEFLRLNRPFSLLGLPSLSMPAGKPGLGAPIGLQLVGAPFSDARLIDLAEDLSPP